MGTFSLYFGGACLLGGLAWLQTDPFGMMPMILGFAMLLIGIMVKVGAKGYREIHGKD